MIVCGNPGLNMWPACRAGLSVQVTGFRRYPSKGYRHNREAIPTELSEAAFPHAGLLLAVPRSLTPLGVGVQSTGRRARKPGMPVTRSPPGDPSIRSVQATINGVNLARKLLLGDGDAPGPVRAPGADGGATFAT